MPSQNQALVKVNDPTLGVGAESLCREGPKAGQGALYLTHPALRALYPPEKRIVLPARYTMCAGRSLVEAYDYLTDVVTRLAKQANDRPGAAR